MLALIAAVARNGVIGRDGKLPWHLPEDLRHFRRTTTGGVVVMGRRTFDSIGRPLPGRHRTGRIVEEMISSAPAAAYISAARLTPSRMCRWSYFEIEYFHTGVPSRRVTTRP